MSVTNRVSEVMYPLNADYPDSHGVGTVNGSFVSLANYHRAFLMISVGEMQATATLAASIRQATSTAGAGAKAITGKSITVLTQAGGDGDQLVCIELDASELDSSNLFHAISVRMVTAVAAVEYSYILYGVEPRFAPVPTTNFTEIVS